MIIGIKQTSSRKTREKGSHFNYIAAGLGILLILALYPQAKPLRGTETPPVYTNESAEDSLPGRRDQYNAVGNSDLQQAFSSGDNQLFFSAMESFLQPNTQPVVLQRLQNELETANQQMILYAKTDTMLYVMLVGKQIRYLGVHAQYYLDSMYAFRQLCMSKKELNSNYDRFKKLSFYLYRLLFAPLQVEPGRIVIAGGEKLLPFDALTTDASGTNFLLYQFAITYTRSAGEYLAGFGQSNENPTSFLGITPGEFQRVEKEPALFGANSSLQKIGGNFYRNASFDQTSGQDRPANTAKNRNLLHIYAHAGYEKGKPVFYLQNQVGAEAFSDPEQPIELAFLAGCETRGYREDNLKTRFLNAGAFSVVATDWQAESIPMYAISEVFYELIVAGVPKDLALQEARIRFLRTASRCFILPYYWAGISLSGNCRAVFSSKQHGTDFYLAILSNFFFFGLSITKEKKRSGHNIL